MRTIQEINNTLVKESFNKSMTIREHEAFRVQSTAMMLNFREVLIKSGSAEQLVAYDTLRTAIETMAVKPLNVALDVPLSATVAGIVGIGIVLILGIAPWMYGLYKFFA